jgi:hypothetical protein
LRALPLADAAVFERAARRTTLVRVALVVLVAMLAALALFAARDEGPSAGAAPAVPEAPPLVVVADVSASVSGAADEAIASMLRRVAARRDGSAGLVLFGDAAVEALPSGTAAGELPRFVPFFRPPPGRADYYATEPWAAALGSGTRISAGLRAARISLERDAGGAGDVVLVSDLDTSEDDRARLERELAAYAAARLLDLHVVPVPGTDATDEAFFRARVGQTEGPAAIDFTPAKAAEPAAPFPARLALLVVLIGLALALRELLVVPIGWRREGVLDR